MYRRPETTGSHSTRASGESRDARLATSVAENRIPTTATREMPNDRISSTAVAIARSHSATSSPAPVRSEFPVVGKATRITANPFRGERLGHHAQRGIGGDGFVPDAAGRSPLRRAPRSQASAQCRTSTVLGRTNAAARSLDQSEHDLGRIGGAGVADNLTSGDPIVQVGEHCRAAERQ